MKIDIDGDIIKFEGTKTELKTFSKMLDTEKAEILIPEKVVEKKVIVVQQEKKVRHKGHHWKRNEDAIIKESYATKGPAYCRKELRKMGVERSRGAISQRACKFKIKFEKRYGTPKKVMTPEEKTSKQNAQSIMMTFVGRRTNWYIKQYQWSFAKAQTQAYADFRAGGQMMGTVTPAKKIYVLEKWVLGSTIPHTLDTFSEYMDALKAKEDCEAESKKIGEDALYKIREK